MTLRTLIAATALVLLPGLNACSIEPVLEPANQRAFSFERDTLAFDNETRWKYQNGKHSGYAEPDPKDPEGEYTLHCFVMSRSVRQFFQFARFDAGRSKLDEDGYRKLVEQVIAHDPSETEPEQRVVIPGYASLRSFSAAHEDLLKDQLGSSAQSFLQRGNWRMVFPFSQDHQEETATSMLAEVRRHRPPVVHLATFPQITINHAVLLYAASESDGGIRFSVYDPNNSAKPTTLSFDKGKRSFVFPPAPYFAGGEVNAYEVYKSAVL